jgi:hypothetical protein
MSKWSLARIELPAVDFGKELVGRVAVGVGRGVGLELPAAPVKDELWLSYLDLAWLSARHQLTSDLAANITGIGPLTDALIAG